MEIIDLRTKTPEYILKDAIARKQIYVFGSNTEGRHGAGDALVAKTYYGAIYGQAIGLQGAAWGIVTKDLRKPKWLQMRSVGLEWIQMQAQAMMFRAMTDMKDYTFNVQPIGCGLAGFYPEEIAPMFKNHPSNVNLPEVFLKVLLNK